MVLSWKRLGVTSGVVIVVLILLLVLAHDKVPLLNSLLTVEANLIWLWVLVPLVATTELVKALVE